MLSEHISGLALERRGEPLLDRHVEAAAGGDVDDRVGRLLDARQELHEHGRIRRRAAVLRVARMQVQDGGAGLGGRDRLAAISSGVIGSASDMVGVWMPPVIAQVMMTLLDVCAMGSGVLGSFLRVFIGFDRAPQIGEDDAPLRGNNFQPNRYTISPQIPFGAHIMTTMATMPSIRR